MQEPEINVNGWQTIKDYAAAHGFSTQYVSKLIKAGKITYRQYPELNNLKLVLPPKSKN